MGEGTRHRFQALCAVPGYLTAGGDACVAVLPVWLTHYTVRPVAPCPSPPPSQTWLQQLQAKWNDRAVLQSISERCKAATTAAAAARARRDDALSRRTAAVLAGSPRGAAGGRGGAATATAATPAPLAALLRAVLQDERGALRRLGQAREAAAREGAAAVRAVAWTSATAFVARSRRVGDAAARAVATVRGVTGCAGVPVRAGMRGGGIEEEWGRAACFRLGVRW